MRGDMFCIQCYGEVAARQKVVVGNRRYRYKRAGMGHAGGIHSRSENGNLVVRGSKSFDTLKSLLPIIQSWCHTMYTEVRVFDKFGLAPLFRLGVVVGFDVTVDCHEIQ